MGLSIKFHFGITKKILVSSVLSCDPGNSYQENLAEQKQKTSGIKEAVCFYKQIIKVLSTELMI